jgi:hypothetical protein
MCAQFKAEGRHVGLQSVTLNVGLQVVTLNAEMLPKEQNCLMTAHALYSHAQGVSQGGQSE